MPKLTTADEELRALEALAWQDAERDIDRALEAVLRAWRSFQHYRRLTDECRARAATGEL